MPGVDSAWGMPEDALLFFRALFAPFPHAAYYKKPNKNRPPETYLDVRWIMWRLDSVCGPAGWACTFRNSLDGLVCALSIKCPTTEGWVWITKEDGAGAEDMGTKRGGEMVPDEDNTAKSAHTNALRRVASNVWGFGRNLYGDRKSGDRVPMPIWVQDLWSTDEEPVRGRDREDDRDRDRPRDRDHDRDRDRDDNRGRDRDRDRDRDDDRDRPRSRERRSESRDRGYSSRGDDEESSRRPRTEARQPTRQHTDTPPVPIAADAGTKYVYKWFKMMEERFNIDVLGKATVYAQRKGYPKRTDEWNGPQLEDVVSKVIEAVKQLDTYNGEFDARMSDFNASPPPRGHVDAPTRELASPSSSAIEFRRSIKSAVLTLLTTMLSRTPQNVEILATIGELSALAKNRHGVTGEVMDLQTWQSTDDTVWLRNILKEAQLQIQGHAASLATDGAKPPPSPEPEKGYVSGGYLKDADDIPF